MENEEILVEEETLNEVAPVEETEMDAYDEGFFEEEESNSLLVDLAKVGLGVVGGILITKGYQVIKPKAIEAGSKIKDKVKSKFKKDSEEDNKEVIDADVVIKEEPKTKKNQKKTQQK
jgi:hypothetical protein